MTSPNPSEPRTGHQLYHASALAPVTASKLLATAILTIYGVQIVLVGAGMLELAAAAISDVVVVAGVIAYARARRLAAVHVGLRRPARRFVVAGVLVGLSAWYLNLRIVVLIEPPGDPSSLQAIVEQTPLVVTLLGIALLPAIAEELVFRGIFVRALATRLHASTAIILGGGVFALFHLLPAQIVSTFGLGLALSYLTLRADSAIPAVIAHLLNNSIAIVIARNELPSVGAWMSAHGHAMLAITALLTVGGLALAARGPA
jgi:membrane protease YdiL (CAAX protease family)